MGIKKVFVGNLGNVVSDDMLRKHFQEYGEIIDVITVEDKQTGFRGYGFITFRSQKEAEDAVNAMQFTIINGRRLTVQMAKSEHEKERFRGRARSRSPPAHHYRGARHRSRSRSREREWGRGRDRRRDWGPNTGEYGDRAPWGRGDGRYDREYGGRDRGGERWWGNAERIGGRGGAMSGTRRRESRWNRDGDDHGDGRAFSGGNSYQGGGEWQADEYGGDYQYQMSGGAGKREMDQFKAFHQQIHSQPSGHGGDPYQYQDQYQDDVPYRRISVDEDPYAVAEYLQQRSGTRDPQYGGRAQQHPYQEQAPPVSNRPSTGYDYDAPASSLKRRDYYQQEADSYQQHPPKKLPSNYPLSQSLASRQDSYISSSNSRQTAAASASSRYSSQDQDWDYRQNETGNSYQQRALDPRTSSATAAESAMSSIGNLRSGRPTNDYQSAQPPTRPAKWDQDYAAAAASKPKISRWSPPPPTSSSSTAPTATDYSSQQRSLSRFQTDYPYRQSTTERDSPASVAPQIASQSAAPLKRQSDTYEGYSPTRPQIYGAAAAAAAATAAGAPSRSSASPATASSAYGRLSSAESTLPPYKSSNTDPRRYPSQTATTPAAAAGASLRSNSGGTALSSASLARSSYAEAYQPRSTLSASSYGASSLSGTTGTGSRSFAGGASASTSTSGITPSYWSSQSAEKSYGVAASIGSSAKTRSATENAREPIRFGFVGPDRGDASSSAYSSYSSFRQSKTS